MLSVPPVETLSRQAFDDRSLRKGARYAAQGRVLNTSVTIRGNALEIHGRVEGSEREPYSVIVRVRPGKNRPTTAGTCTCPVGLNCKHVVAVIAAAAQQTPEDEAQPLARIGPGGKVLPAQPLSPMLESWLEELKRPPVETVAAKPPAGTRTLLYVLGPGRYGNPELHVQLMTAQTKKNGQFGKAARCSAVSYPREMFANPSFAQDVSLLKLLYSENGSLENVPLAGADGAAILRKLLDTGRCFWLNVNEKPLALGEVRPAVPVWRELEDGSQQATFDISPPAAAILPLSPPWYVDPVSSTCGPLTVEGDPRIAKHWLRAPVVPPGESVAVANHVQSLSLPAPRALLVRNVGNVLPTPVLRLEKVTLEKPIRVFEGTSWHTRDVSALEVAWVEFDYDGIRATVNTRGDFVSRKRGDIIERIDRLLDLEESKVDEARESGLIPVQRLISGAVPPNLQGAFALRDAGEWTQWVMNMLPGAKRHGWHADIDPSFRYRPVAVEEWYSTTEAQGAGADWFDYELGIMVEGERVNLLPLMGKILATLNEPAMKKARRANMNVQLPDGRLLSLPTERLRAIAATLAELFDPEALTDGHLRVGKLRAAELIDLNDNTTWRGPGELRELATKLKAFEGITKKEPPTGLQATLRPYQEEGVSWLQFLREHDFGGILADDMGLGKTVQAIAHILVEKESGRATGPSLVIAPTSLMGNWRAEAAKFAPGLKVLVLHGGGRKERFEEIAAHDLIVTTYALLPRDRETLEKHAFHLLILDEAQYIKNPRTQWAEIVRSLSAKHRLCMTGTPMENHLGELWSLMHFLSPGYLGSEKQFRRIYRDPIEKGGDQERRSALAKRIRPFIMRRRKEDVLTELPPKTEIVRNVELDGKQRDLYETIRLAMHERVRAEVESKGMSRSHIVILDALLKLRQVCCDPRLVKLERARQVKESAKLDLLKEMLPELIGEGRRVLLFSQFTGMLDLIEDAVTALKIPFVRLTGDTTDRDTPVQRFQNGEVPLFLISLKAGGTGLNLTAADTVIHYDPWWNPAVERQATDRAHRIGQDKSVFVYKLVTTGTVEEKILAMQERKKELVAGLLGEGAQENLQLSKQDLDHLFDPLG